MAQDHYYAFGLKITGISSKKLPDANEGNIDNKNLYNDKELFEDADLDWYDYGFRNYDPQIGRFPQLDPLTDGYPHYTPYQYAGNEPIANVDVDGLEEFNILQVLNPVIITAKKAAPYVAKASSIAGKLATRLALITARGVSDALVNANTLGLSDAFGNNHLESYDDPYEKAAYLRGRLGGAAIAAAQGASEINTGGGIALTTGVETAGVGAGVGMVVALHGTGTAATAAADATWALKKLYQLNIATHGATGAGASSPSEPIKFEQPPDTPAPKGETGTGNYKKIKGNKAADKESQNLNYKDAHDLKRSHVGKGNESKFDIYKDRKTGKLKLFNKSKKVGIDVDPN